MPDNINYTKINWKNGAEGGTPLNATNLDKMDSAISDLERELIEIQGSGTSALQMKQDGTSGTFDFTGKNPHAYQIDETLTGQITYGAIGNFATAFGGKSQASGKRSMAQGTTTVAKGDYSHAEGNNSVALGVASHTEGTATTASGYSSHAEGHETQALNSAAHAEGYGTIASGTQSHAEGNGSTASGTGSHATGNHTQASGQYSSTAGSQTLAAYSDQFVVGRFNNNKDNTLFEVGNGEPTYRTNAFEVFDDGHAEVLVQGMQDRAVTTKYYVDNIRAVAEDKCTTYILNVNTSLATLKTSYKVELYNPATGEYEDITTALKNGDYDNVGIHICNSIFNTSDDPIMFSLNYPMEWLAIGEVSYRLIDLKKQTPFKVGDVFLFTNVDVPDRWYTKVYSNSKWYKFGIKKLNIEDGTGKGSIVQKDAIYDGAAIVLNNETNGTQPGDTVPGAEVTGFQSVAFGGLRYDYVNTQEGNFGSTPTLVTGNQSMAVGGSVHVNGDWSFAAGKDHETYQRLAFAAGGGHKVGQTEEEFNALWNWNLNENGQPIDADKKTYDKSSSLSAAFGETNTITRRACFAAGSSNVVARDYSAAFGRWNEITAAGGTTQFVCGYYNLNNANDIFEVGNGSTSQRKNAFNVTTDGKAYIGGSVTKADAANTLTTKDYVDTNFIDKSTHPTGSDNIPCIQAGGAQIWKNISETAYWSNGQLKAWSAMMRNSAGKSEVATATSSDNKYTIANKEYVDTRIPEAPNADGTYVLKCTVTNGVKKYNWIKE